MFGNLLHGKRFPKKSTPSWSQAESQRIRRERQRTIHLVKSTQKKLVTRSPQALSHNSWGGLRTGLGVVSSRIEEVFSHRSKRWRAIARWSVISRSLTDCERSRSSPSWSITSARTFRISR